MAVTMQQIADLAGVSRGTVDRALNNRGRIRPEVAEKIKMIAKELGYQPNIAAKALSSGNQILRIGVILQYADTPTIQTVLEGAKDAKQEVERFGGRVMIDQINGGDGVKNCPFFFRISFCVVSLYLFVYISIVRNIINRLLYIIAIKESHCHNIWECDCFYWLFVSIHGW